jgi:HD-GYP domain-containing protein (c-di-GMP phosphodiesterase class II)
MQHEEAVRVLKENAGTQLDPAAVLAFLELGDIARKPAPVAEPMAISLQHLSDAVRSTAAEEIRA